MKCKKCEHDIPEESSMCSFCGEEVKKENFFQKIGKKFGKKEKTEKKKSTPAAIGTLILFFIIGAYEDLVLSQKYFFPSLETPLLIILLIGLLITLIIRFPQKSSLIGGIFFFGLVANGMFLSGHVVHQDAVQEKNMKQDFTAFAKDIENGEIHKVANPQSILGFALNDMIERIDNLDKEFAEKAKEYDAGLDMNEAVRDKSVIEKRLQAIALYKETAKQYNTDIFDIQIEYLDTLLDKTAEEEIQKIYILDTENRDEKEKEILQKIQRIKENQQKEWEEDMKIKNELEEKVLNAEMKTVAFLIQNHDSLQMNTYTQNFSFQTQERDSNYNSLFEKLIVTQEEYAKYLLKKQQDMMNEADSIRNM